MFTYQDFLQLKTEDAIQQAIAEFKASDRYNRAIEAQAYYRGNNTGINGRYQTYRNEHGNSVVDEYVANNRIANEFFKKITMQENSYLLGNGVNVPEEIKKGLGRTFDNAMFNLGSNALVDGVAWAYCFLDKYGKFAVTSWRGTEFVPLFDEMTGDLKAGIRFRQVDPSKPMYIELFEEDGKTVYVQNGSALTLREPKKNYIIKKNVVKALNLVEEEQQGFGILPIVPLYANSLKESTFTNALKQKLDLYDIVVSDFGNNLEDSMDIYWVLTNYAGQDIGEFLAEYKQYKIIQTDNEGSAEAKTIDVPYQAREILLNMLKKEIFQSAMAMDTEELTGSNLTNVAIKSIMANLDLKTDDFEMQALECLYEIMMIYKGYAGITEEFEIELERRTLINDAETVQLIYTMREDIDLQTALEKNPLISPKEVEEIMRRKEEETYNFDIPQGEEE